MGVGGGGSRGGRGVGLLRGGAAPAGPPRGGRQPPDGPQATSIRSGGSRPITSPSSGHAGPGARRRPSRSPEVLVAGSTYQRGHLKRRLLAEGLKARRNASCAARATCGAAGRCRCARPRQRRTRRPPAREPRIAVPELQRDARHALRQAQGPQAPRPRVSGVRRGVPAHHRRQRYCSPSCAGRGEANQRQQRARRRVIRPPYEQLVREIDALGYAGVGRRYGVSDNAVRKWRRTYESDGPGAL